MNLVELFKQGGFIMYPLLVFSIALWTVAIQKIWFLMNFKKEARYFYDEALKIVKTKRFNEMEWLYKNCPEIISRPHAAIFEDVSSKDEWDARMQRRLAETSLGLKKNLWVLGTIGYLHLSLVYLEQSPVSWDHLRPLVWPENQDLQLLQAPFLKRLSLQLQGY